MTPRCVYPFALLFMVFAWFLGGKLGLLKPREFVRLVGVGSTAPAGGEASDIFYYKWVPVDALPGPGTYWQRVELWQLSPAERRLIR